MLPPPWVKERFRTVAKPARSIAALQIGDGDFHLGALLPKMASSIPVSSGG